MGFLELCHSKVATSSRLIINHSGCLSAFGLRMPRCRGFFKFSRCKPQVSALLALMLSSSLGAQTIVFNHEASEIEQLAAQEVRRYVYLRTGALLPIKAASKLPHSGDLIAVASAGSELISSSELTVDVPIINGAFTLQSTSNGGDKLLIIAGHDDMGTLYGAYRFAEHMGVSFGLAADAIPDGVITLELDGYDEVGVPRFETRGVLPYHDFFPGPDGWTQDDYLTVISQLPKLGINFIGFHTYMTRYGNQWMRDNDYRTGPEPTVWVGLPDDLNADGSVSWSYPTSYAHTHRERSWGFSTWDAQKFAAGSQDLFASDGAGAPLIGPEMPSTIAQSNEIFDRVGSVWASAFGLANELGVQTAVGTELPLGLEPAGDGDIDPPEDWVRGMTQELKNRITERGDDPADPAVVREVYRGIFERIMRTHPLDYYWFWTYEIWSSNPDGPGVTPEQVLAIEADIKIAQEVLNDLGNPFKIAQAGWILGTSSNHAELESAYTADVPFYSSWGEADGYDKLSPERVKWPGIHLEQDWGLLQWQGSVYAAWEDIVAAQRIGAKGSIGNIWRTTILDANIAGVKDLHWAYGSSSSPPNLEIVGNKWDWMETLYRDWSQRQFGPEVSSEVATLLSEYDGQVPTPTGWTEWGPGEVLNNPTPWTDLQSTYSFVDDLEALRDKVIGKANLGRFDYWLRTMQLLRVMAEFGTVRYDFERAMENSLYEEALDRMKALARLHERVTTLQLERAKNASDIGEIIQFQLVNWKAIILDRFENTLRNGLGRPIPTDAYPTSDYHGTPRVFVSPARGSIRKGETLSVTATVLGTDITPKVLVRPLGAEDYQELTMETVAKAVYRVELPLQSRDFEYQVSVATPSATLRWPMTAQDHTVVVAGAVCQSEPVVASAIFQDGFEQCIP